MRPVTAGVLGRAPIHTNAYTNSKRRGFAQMNRKKPGRSALA